MMRIKLLLNLLLVSLIFFQCSAKNDAHAQQEEEPVVLELLEVGAAQVDSYLNLLKDKRIGVVANQTSMIAETHLVDSFLNLGLNVMCVFSPEHGFRGEADAGEKVASAVDAKTGLPLISLYGKNKKPSVSQLKDLDFVVFDIQDVGARFYTYISTMHYVMEACAENNIPFLVLDRPNPNGHYVDGPVLEKEFYSFVGMHPVPVVHGMTVGEYAQMINEEGWLKNAVKCELMVIKCQNYTHDTLYELPIKPSPNLPNRSAIYLYPSLCLFEGTPISVGRGTDSPFQVIGYPGFPIHDFSFTPESLPGAKNPKLKGEKCFGYNLFAYGNTEMKERKQLNLSWLITFYETYPHKEEFFKSFFNKLSGNDELQEQIKKGMDEQLIRDSWKDELEAFKLIRKKHLLYTDFE